MTEIEGRPGMGMAVGVNVCCDGSICITRYVIGRVACSLSSLVPDVKVKLLFSGLDLRLRMGMDEGI